MDAMTGKWPPTNFPFTVNGNTRTLLYYLVDGIYPRLAFFVAPYPRPSSRKQQVFNRLQEALRKDVERLFAVLTRRFHVFMHPARHANVTSLVLTVQAVVVLHNMVTELRRDGYRSSTKGAEAAGEEGGEVGAAAGDVHAGGSAATAAPAAAAAAADAGNGAGGGVAQGDAIVDMGVHSAAAGGAPGGGGGADHGGGVGAARSGGGDMLDAVLWGKPPDRGDTTPQHEPGTGREQSRNTPLGG